MATNLKEEANKDASATKYRVTLIYADYGKRKTTTAASMVNEKGLIISSDDSWKVLDNPRHASIRERITKIIKYDGLTQLDHIDYEGYDTVVLDTISHAVDMYLDLLYDEANWGGKYRDQLVSRNPELRGKTALAPIDYNATRSSFRPVLNRLFKMPVHWVFTSQVNDPIEGLSKDRVRKPAIPYSTHKIIATRADIIGYIKPESKSLVVGVDETDLGYIGKSRIEGINGKMSLDSFVEAYKRLVFT